ncbi:DUF6640 family protein [Caulobacter sp. RL271]|uniref:Acetyltransferase n=1 Tax=Caulobacter segnis TaxID=88688 RepID=A0ABY4ZRU9_9CAUL|nr:DUF6640 family protein [Caulobacter segnis]USQ95323.1 hypothetical protein MZV50_22675 [Caulobacter segnis]
MNRPLVARCLFTINAVGIAVGGFVADWNGSHIFNPRWPPHAKFHDGQTLAFGVLLAAATLFFAWRRSGDRRTNILAATITGGVLYWAQAGAFFAPGVAWTDPEFLKAGQSLDDFPPQIYFEVLGTLVVGLASWLAWPSRTDQHPELSPRHG